MQEQQTAADSSTGLLAQNAIVPAPVVTLPEVSVPSQSSAVRVSRPSPLQTVDIGIIISTGEVEGYDTTVEIDATATLHGTAPPPRGLEQRRGTTGTLRGAAASFQRPSGDLFALRAPLRPSEAVRLPEGTEVLSPSIAPAAQYAEARTASRLAVARFSIVDEEAPPNQYRRRLSSDPRTMDVSALFYRIDAEALGPPSSPISTSPSSSQVGLAQSRAKPSRWKAFRLRSPVAFYSLITTLLVFLVWGCVRLAVKP
ncbi:MAG TPA: hypothetical protein VKP30_15680 [Polyangiaceae bacterium]|nr:hypothetical protein [Polyangiaceae bacterium]